MAKSTQKSLELAELILRSDVARFQIGQAHHKLKQKLDIPLRIRDSLKSSPLKWLGGSLGVGFMGSFLFRSKRRQQPQYSIEKKHGGWFTLLLLISFSLAKPALEIYATKFLKDYLQNQLKGRSSSYSGNSERNPY